MKPIKRGFNMWVRADSHNGCLCNFDIYTGNEESAEVNLGAKVVKKLLTTLVGKRYHLYLTIRFFCFSNRRSGRQAVCLRHLQDRRGLPQAIVKVSGLQIYYAYQCVYIYTH